MKASWVMAATAAVAALGAAIWWESLPPTREEIEYQIGVLEQRVRDVQADVFRAWAGCQEERIAVGSGSGCEKVAALMADMGASTVRSLRARIEVLESQLAGAQR